MIATLSCILSITIIGVPLAIALHPGARWPARLGLAFFLGCGWTTAVMLALSLAHVRWSLLSIVGTAALPSLLLLPLALKRLKASTASPAPSSTPASIVIDFVTLYLIAGYTVSVTLGPMWEWDFWAIFGVKARAFFEYGGIDWNVLTSPFNLYNNPDYPLALPLLFDFSAIANGAWDDRWIGLYYPAFTLALLLVVRPLVARESDSPLLASAVTLLLAALSFTETAGTAEAPLVALGGAALLVMRRALLDDDADALRTGAVLLGIAALMKNEGIAMTVAAAIAIALVTRNRKRVASLWPAFACAASWLVTVRLFGLQSAYLQTASMWERLQTHLRQLPDIARALAVNPPAHPLFWAAAMLLLVIAYREAKRERFLLACVAAQLLMYIAAYLVTSHPVVWQIHNSWARLLSHVAIPLAFAAVTSGLRWWDTTDVR